MTTDADSLAADTSQPDPSAPSEPDAVCAAPGGAHSYPPDDPIRYQLLRLRATSDADPGVLPRILGLFQNLNVTPRQVRAEFTFRGGEPRIHLSVDVSELSPERLSLVAAKICQTPCVLNAYWHYL